MPLNHAIVSCDVEKYKLLCVHNAKIIKRRCSNVAWMVAKSSILSQFKYFSSNINKKYQVIFVSKLHSTNFGICFAYSLICNLMNRMEEGASFEL